MRRDAVSIRVVAAWLVLAAPAVLAAQTPAPGAGPAPSKPAAARTTSPKPAPGTIMRTSWGDPDLQGLWSNSTTTPLERPAALADKEFLTEQEAKALDAAQAIANDTRSS